MAHRIRKAESKKEHEVRTYTLQGRRVRQRRCLCTLARGIDPLHRRQGACLPLDPAQPCAVWIRAMGVPPRPAPKEPCSSGRQRQGFRAPPPTPTASPVDQEGRFAAPPRSGARLPNPDSVIRLRAPAGFQNPVFAPPLGTEWRFPKPAFATGPWTESRFVNRGFVTPPSG